MGASDLGGAAAGGVREFPLQWSWRLALLTLPVGGGLAAGMCALELAGLWPRGALLGEAGDGERWFGLAFGLLVQPFGLSALLHGRLRLQGDALHHLRLGFVCRSEALSLRDVVRWGSAFATNRGRRERHLRFALRDGSRQSIKLAMYREPARILAELERRLGPPAPTSAVLGGIEFDDER